MKFQGIFRPLLTGAIAGLLVACSKTDRDAGNEKATANEPRVQRGANGAIVVSLDGETQQRIGMKSEHPPPGRFQPEVKAYGLVLDGSPLVALIAEFESARAIGRASRQEYERLKVLAEQKNASARALQTAEAMAKRDEVLVESARAKLVLGWGRKLAGQEDLASFARSLTAGDVALVRIDLPAGEAVPTPPPASARLVAVADEDHPRSAEFFDLATSVDPQTQGRGFLYLLEGKLPPPGTAVTGYLKVAGEPLTGVIVPRSAVVRHEGRAWVYLQTDDLKFVRREIALDRSDENGWFVGSGVSEQDRIVVSGAQTILSEELSGVVFMSGARE